MHGFSGWAPFFARVVSPASRATIADQMFAGGYLDGVVEHEDLDRRATDALGLTPLLTHEQLASWRSSLGKASGAPRTRSATCRRCRLRRR